MLENLRLLAGDLSGPDTHVVILASSMPTFVAGADLNMVDGCWPDLSATIQAFQDAFNAWAGIPAATIAVIGGHALGGGCELTLVCGWRLMARGKPRIGCPEARFGLLPAGGGTQRLARLVGVGRALDLCSRGRVLEADEAERIGLITEAVDADVLDARAEELAEELLRIPQLTLRAIQRCILLGSDRDLASGLRLEAAEMLALGDTADTQEGVRAFVEKRDPVFAHR